jgi:2-isopropylmalate synthase
MPALPVAPDVFHVYDTTLRDGAQQEGLRLTVQDKLRIARSLDDLAITYIEGGWPGANPNDTAFFKAAADGELVLRNAQLVAFGATRKAGGKASSDRLTRALLDANTSTITLVAKSHDKHVHRALHTTLEENLAMVADTVRFLTDEGRHVFLDAAIGPTRSTPSRSSRWRPNPALSASSCATPTAACCPAGWARS